MARGGASCARYCTVRRRGDFEICASTKHGTQQERLVPTVKDSESECLRSLAVPHKWPHMRMRSVNAVRGRHLPAPAARRAQNIRAARRACFDRSARRLAVRLGGSAAIVSRRLREVAELGPAVAWSAAPRKYCWHQAPSRASYDRLGPRAPREATCAGGWRAPSPACPAIGSSVAGAQAPSLVLSHRPPPQRSAFTVPMPARTRYYATAAAAAAVAAVAAVVVRRRRRRRPVGYSVRDYNPPLPDEVAHMLESCSLCYLATASGDPPEPHLSLMNFTYVRGDEVIVFTSRSDTLKMQNLNSNSSVSLLVHVSCVAVVAVAAARPDPRPAATNPSPPRTSRPTPRPRAPWPSPCRE